MSGTNSWTSMRTDGETWRLCSSLSAASSGWSAVRSSFKGTPPNCSTRPLRRTRIVDISGTALEDVDGNGVENVSVVLLEAESRAELQSTVTDGFGYFSMKNVAQEVHIIVFSKEGYVWWSGPSSPTTSAWTCYDETGNATPVREENDQQSISGWTLDNAVGLSTAIGVLTIGTALLGINLRSKFVVANTTDEANTWRQAPCSVAA